MVPKEKRAGHSRISNSIASLGGTLDSCMEPTEKRDSLLCFRPRKENQLRSPVSGEFIALVLPHPSPRQHVLQFVGSTRYTTFNHGQRQAGETTRRANGL